jgi:hypothetical protein
MCADQARTGQDRIDQVSTTQHCAIKVGIGQVAANQIYSLVRGQRTVIGNSG